MSDINEPWDQADDVTDYTDRDLEASRDWSTRIYDKDGSVRAKVEAYMADGVFEYASTSEVLDAAYRIGCAYYLDTNRTVLPRDRDDFAVNYTIPPRGWVQRTTFEQLELAEPSEPTREREAYLQVSTPSVCDEITEMLIDEGIVEHKRDVCLKGLDILSGHD